MTDFGFYIRKGWLIGLIFALVAAAFYINHEITSDYREKLAEEERQLNAIKTEIALSQQRTDEYHHARADLRAYLGYMYDKKEPQDLIDRIKADAAHFDVKLSDIQINIPRFFKERDNNGAFIPVVFQTTFKGGYFKLEEFLREFEKRPYLDNIEEMNVTGSSPDGSVLSLAMSGTLRVFDKSIIDWCRSDES